MKEVIKSNQEYLKRLSQDRLTSTTHPRFEVRVALFFRNLFSSWPNMRSIPCFFDSISRPLTCISRISAKIFSHFKLCWLACALQSLEPEPPPPSLSPSPAWMTTQAKSLGQGRPAKTDARRARPCPGGCLRHARGKNGGRGKYPFAEACAKVLRRHMVGHIRWIIS